MSEADKMQEQSELIDELITAAGIAARSGDVENKVLATFHCSALVHYIKPDGFWEDDIISRTQNDVEFKAEQYGYFEKYVYAFEDENYRRDSVGDITISFAGESVVIPKFSLPYHPADLMD